MHPDDTAQAHHAEFPTRWQTGSKDFEVAFALMYDEPYHQQLVSPDTLLALIATMKKPQVIDASGVSMLALLVICEVGGASSIPNAFNPLYAAKRAIAEQALAVYAKAKTFNAVLASQYRIIIPLPCYGRLAHAGFAQCLAPTIRELRDIVPHTVFVGGVKGTQFSDAAQLTLEKANMIVAHGALPPKTASGMSTTYLRASSPTSCCFWVPIPQT